MFDFRLYLYDLNFNDLNESIDLFPALLNEDISLTIERERGVFEKTNSDLSLSFSNFVKLSNGLTIFKYLKDKIATSKFRIKVSKDNQIVFDGYVENESISFDVENETLELNVFAIEKEFWKRCEQIKFSEINPFMSDGVANIPNFQSEPNYIWTLDYILLQIFNKIYEKQYFQDILNLLKLDVLDIVKNQRIGLRDNTLKTGMYWLDRDKFTLKEFFEAIIKIYNLEFKIDYDLKQGIFRNRLVTTGTTIDISNDVVKSGITYLPQIEKFDLVKVNDEADINNEELFGFTTPTFALDTEILHSGISPNYPDPTEEVLGDTITNWDDVNDSQLVDFDGKTLKLYFYVENLSGQKFISKKAFHEKLVPDSLDHHQYPQFTIPIISDMGFVTKRIVRITGGSYSGVVYENSDSDYLYTVYEIEINNNFEERRIIDAITNNALNFNIKYFVTEAERDAYLFDGYETINENSYLDINGLVITDEKQIKRANVFELENELKLKFHEDKNNDGILNIDEDKPKDATRIQIQKMFNLGFGFYYDLVNSYKNMLKSTSKIECEVNRDDLRIGDKVTINYNDISGDFIINKNEIDLVNGISKIEALSEVIQ